MIVYRVVIINYLITSKQFTYSRKQAFITFLLFVT